MSLVGRVVATRLGSEEGPLVYSGRRFGRFAVGRESGLDPIDTRNNSIRHCIQCGSSVVSATLQGDVVVRPICRQCGHVHYVNSTVVVGCVTETRDGRILMCKRRISPRKGYWTFPSGFLECGESGPEGARRETLEEACAEVHIDGLLCVINVPQMSEVHLVYRGLLLPSTLSATPESSEVALVAEADVAWQDLAFTSIRESLRCFFEDRRAKRRRAHMLDLRAAPPDDNRDEILPVVALNGSTGDPPAAEVSSRIVAPLDEAALTGKWSDRILPHTIGASTPICSTWGGVSALGEQLLFARAGDQARCVGLAGRTWPSSGFVLQLFGKESLHIHVEGSCRREHLGIRGPTQALVPLRAVGGNVDKVAFLAPDNIVLKLIEKCV